MNKLRNYFTLAVAVFSMAGFVTLVSPSESSAAELTTWQKFIKKDCTGSADAAERCAANHETELRKKCGPKKKNDKYTNCWRKYIRDNGGQAGPNSSPYEVEKAPRASNNGPLTCKDIQTSVVSCDSEGGNPVMSIVQQIANFLAIGVGIAVVGGIVWGSLLYTTSNGEPAKAQQGITVIVNAVIGLLLFIFTYAIIDFLTPGSGII